MEETNLFNKNVLSMDISEVRKMFEMASKMDNPVNLTLGLPDYDCLSVLKEEAIKAIREGFNKYTLTSGILELKIKIKEKLNERNNICVDVENILITNAVSGGLSIVLTAILNQGDEVLLFDPYFVGYKQLVLQNGGNPVYVKTNDDFSLDLLDFESKISEKSKAVIINSPNNPTGRVYSKDELVSFAHICKKRNLLVISDEIYEDFVYEGEHFSIGSIYDNTVTLNGFSKSYGATGWRVGYLVAPKHIILQVMKVQQFNFVCAPSPFQRACIKCFEIDVSDYVKRYSENARFVYEKLKDNYSLDIPKGAFYAYIKYPYDGDRFIGDCIKNNLLVVPGKSFSQNDTHFRISFCTSKDNLERGISILNKIFLERAK